MSLVPTLGSLTAFVDLFHIKPPKHPDDTLSERTTAWTAVNALLAKPPLQLADKAPFRPEEAQKKLNQITQHERECQHLVAKAKSLERVAQRALALESTLKIHRKRVDRSSSIDWLNLETLRARDLRPINSNLNKEQQKLVHPQSEVELHCAVAPTKKKLSFFQQALSWVKTPLNVIRIQYSKGFFPENAQVSLPHDTKKCIQKTYQGIHHKTPTPLGQGRFGEISSVRWGNDTYARKQVNRSLENSSKHFLQATGCLAREGAAYMSLSHPNILRLEGFSEDGLLLEQVSGGTLKEQLADVKLKKKELITYLLDIVDALIYLHRQGYTYKDLKPQNVLIDAASKHAKLCDLGFIMRTQGDMIPSGSPCYQAPECSRANTKQPISAKADSWSFGVLAYKALVGGASVPFPPTQEEATHSRNQQYILRQSQERFGKPCGEIFAHLDQRAKKFIRQRDITTALFQQQGILQTLIIDCLHGDPAQRLSMEQIKKRLQQYQARC